MYHLIIVDDEARILDGIANLFPWENIGFQVDGVFTGGRQALAYLDAHPADVVMSDIRMPEMDGIEFIRRLEKFPRIKIVLFSSYQNYEYFRSAIKYQVADYLLKPIRYEELLNCFSELRKTLDAATKPCAPEDKPRGYYEKIVAAVEDYLGENYRDATLEKAAGLVSLSSSYLSKVFKEHAGVGFSECLMKVRMEKAREFLDDVRFKSYEIADCVGYDNPKNFSRAFRAFYGMSPTEYRNRKTKGGGEDEPETKRHDDE